jgi:hypothetical protein
LLVLGFGLLVDFVVLLALLALALAVYSHDPMNLDLAVGTSSSQEEGPKGREGQAAGDTAHVAQSV